MSILNYAGIRRLVGLSVAIIFFVGIAAQGLTRVQAETYGYVQADCPNIVKQAIDTVSSECSKVGRGKLCYGNSTITTEYQPGINNVKFDAPGDTVDVNVLKQFSLSGMNTSANTWGVAELKIKADLPDADPSQAVIMILFGSVQLTDASADANAASLAQTPGAVVRQNQQATATTNAARQQATKIAGLEGTATVRAETPIATGTVPSFRATQAAATATILADIINTATAAPLANQSGTNKGLYSGLQAFYFQSADTAPCEQAPHDGILIQSPQGIKQRVTLVIDGVRVSLGSTVYITAQPGKFLTVNTLEGSVQVTAAGKTVTVPPGAAAQVPVDTNLRASGVPIAFDYYTDEAIRALPTAALPRTNLAFAPGLPSSIGLSTWSATETITSGNSSCEFAAHAKSITFQPLIAFNQTALWYKPSTLLVILTRSTPNTYIGNFEDTDITLVVADQYHISGTLIGHQFDGTLCNISLAASRSDSTASTALPDATP